MLLLSMGYAFILVFIYLILRQGLIINIGRLTSNSLCSLGWPPIYHSPAQSPKYQDYICVPPSLVRRSCFNKESNLTNRYGALFIIDHASYS
jgi:hypothetical protein